MAAAAPAAGAGADANKPAVAADVKANVKTKIANENLDAIADDPEVQIAISEYAYYSMKTAVTFLNSCVTLQPLTGEMKPFWQCAFIFVARAFESKLLHFLGVPCMFDAADPRTNKVLDEMKANGTPAQPHPAAYLQRLRESVNWFRAYADNVVHARPILNLWMAYHQTSKQPHFGVHCAAVALPPVRLAESIDMLAFVVRWFDVATEQLATDFKSGAVPSAANAVASAAPAAAAAAPAAAAPAGAAHAAAVAAPVAGPAANPANAAAVASVELKVEVKKQTDETFGVGARALAFEEALLYADAYGARNDLRLAKETFCNAKILLAAHPELSCAHQLMAASAYMAVVYYRRAFDSGRPSSYRVDEAIMNPKIKEWRNEARHGFNDKHQLLKYAPDNGVRAKPNDGMVYLPPEVEDPLLGAIEAAIGACDITVSAAYDKMTKVWNSAGAQSQAEFLATCTPVADLLLRVRTKDPFAFLLPSHDHGTGAHVIDPKDGKPQAFLGKVKPLATILAAMESAAEANIFAGLP